MEIDSLTSCDPDHKQNMKHCVMLLTASVSFRWVSNQTDQGPDVL